MSLGAPMSRRGRGGRSDSLGDAHGGSRARKRGNYIDPIVVIRKCCTEHMGRRHWPRPRRCASVCRQRFTGGGKYAAEVIPQQGSKNGTRELVRPRGG
jgi:hypothetical protein